MKNGKFKRIFSLALIFILCLSMFSCGGSGSGNTTETEETESNNTKETEESTSHISEESSEANSENTTEEETGIVVSDPRCSLIVDIAYEASSRPLTRELINNQMDEYAKMGYEKIFFIPIPDTYASMESCQGSVICDPAVTTDHMHRSVHATLDPNLEYILSCKKAGMEAVIIYRPYEGGGSITVPAAAQAQFSFGEFKTIGGKAAFCVSEFTGNKSAYIGSLEKTTANKAKPNKIEIVFAVGEFKNQTAHDTVETITPDKSAEIKPVLWIAKGDNVNYSQAENVKFTVTDGNRKFTDANGNSLGEMACKIVTVDLSSYSDLSYLALSFENGDLLYTVPFSMITCFDADGKVINTTKTVFSRNPYSDELLGADTLPEDYFWGSERKPIKTTDSASLSAFKAFGFEFQYGGIGSDFGDGWHNAYVYGVAIGEQDMLRGNLDEGRNDVQNYWLELLDRFYAMGADEIIISLENHGGMVYDYTSFGYSNEYAEKYEELYGKNIREEDFDYLKLMEIRGEAFLEFLSDAAKIADRREKKLGIELLEAFENPTLNDDLDGLCHYKMPKIVFDWKKAVDICDSVLVKDHIYGKYDGSVAKNIREYASANGKTAIVTGYESCGADEGFVADALNDSLNGAVALDFIPFTEE